MNKEDKDALLRLARESIASYFSGADAEIPVKPDENRGAFVTLHKGAELRGCIGFPEPIMPLNKAIKELAIAAAFQDPRFPPLSRDELEMIRIEISVLTKPELMECAPEDYYKNINAGKHGLIIRSVKGSGLLLPQVALEQGWDSLELLKNTCCKAGLSPDAWKDSANKCYRFEAEVFSE